MTGPIVELRGVTKRYGHTSALDGLDLRVDAGEIVGLLGPNGAGKTTAVKALVGLTRISSGQGTVLDAPLGDRVARRRIGYLPELFRYQPWLTGTGVLRLHAELAGLPRSGWAAAVAGASAMTGLAGRVDDRVSTYSKGMQQRLGLGVALIGEPALVLLDEPTSALDPPGRVEVREIVRRARDRGAAVILDSHLLSEVEQVADRVVILHRGRNVASGTLAEVVGGGGVRIRVTGLAPNAITGLPGLTGARVDGPWVDVPDAATDRIPDIVAALVGAGGRVQAVEPAARSLEQRFMELVSDAGAIP